MRLNAVCKIIGKKVYFDIARLIIVSSKTVNGVR